MKLSEIKVGDIVRLIANTNLSLNKVGDVGIITEIDSDGDFRVTVQGKEDLGNWSVKKEVVKVKLKITKDFKVGDSVQITGNSSGSCNGIGDIGTITQLHAENGLRIQVIGNDDFGNWTYADEAKLLTK